MSLCLSPAELAELTDLEANSYAAQCRWLDRNGYPFDLSAAGRPKVLRAYVERRHGLAAAGVKSTVEPDFSHWSK